MLTLKRSLTVRFALVDRVVHHLTVCRFGVDILHLIVLGQDYKVSPFEIAFGQIVADRAAVVWVGGIGSGFSTDSSVAVGYNRFQMPRRMTPYTLPQDRAP